MAVEDSDIVHLKQRVIFLENAFQTFQEEVNTGLRKSLKEYTMRTQVLEEKLANCRCDFLSEDVIPVLTVAQTVVKQVCKKEEAETDDEDNWDEGTEDQEREDEEADVNDNQNPNAILDQDYIAVRQLGSSVGSTNSAEAVSRRQTRSMTASKNSDQWFSWTNPGVNGSSKVVIRWQTRGRKRSPPSVYVSDDEESESDANDQLVCSTCLIGFSSSKHLEAHQTRCRPKNGAHKCSQCDYSADKSKYLKAHLLKHSSHRPFSCLTCGNAFKTKSSLTSHMNVHKPRSESLFKCNQCPKIYSYRSSLSKHLRNHTGDKPIACTDCDMRFYEKSFLLDHQRRKHTGERPFSCTHCTMSFSSKSVLKNHVIRVHTKEYPITCGGCSIGFLRNADFHRHKCNAALLH